MANISTKIAGIRLINPVLPAAGPNVRNSEAMLAAIAGGAGGIVSKTVSIRPANDPRPTIRKAVCSGLMNCETWSEIPVENFLDDLREVKSAGAPLIVSIGYRPEEVGELGALIAREIEPDGFEFSVHYVGHSVGPIVDVAKALRKVVEQPVFMKVSPNFLDIEKLAFSVAPYVDGFVAINSFGPVLDFDPENFAPKLGSGYGQGWLSGPPLLSIALRIVHQIASVTDKPIIGVGGIEKGIDAIKFFMAGASAVGICSAAIKKGHGIYGAVAEGIGKWLDDYGYGSVREIVGLYNSNLEKRRVFEKIPVNRVDIEKCVGCGACISKCLQGALYMNEETADVIPEKCIGCGYCVDFCPQGALDLVEQG